MGKAVRGPAMQSRFKPLAKPGSLADHAHQAIFERILSGAVQPGDRLNELRIAAQLGTSRGPVREAIQRLRQDGLVELRPGRGPVVALMAGAAVRELCALCATLERTAIRAVPTTGWTSLADALDGLLARMRAGSGGAETAGARAAFHAAIAAASDNALLIELHGGLLPRLRLAFAGERTAAPQDYEAVRDAVRRGNAAEAERRLDALTAGVILNAAPRAPRASRNPIRKRPPP